MKEEGEIAFERTKVKEEGETALERTKVKEEGETISGRGGNSQVAGNIEFSLTIFYKYLDQT